MKTARKAQSGAFIVIEGIDGAGTTTQARQLAETLSAVGNDVRLTCEPTDGPVGKLIRQMLEQGPAESGAGRRPNWSLMALLFAADRLDHLNTLVLPALNEGAVVISDRYLLSSLVYQSVTAPTGTDALPWIRHVNAHAIVADLTIVIDVSIEAAAQRRVARGGAPQLFEVDDIQRQLAEVYQNAERLVALERLVHISGEAERSVVSERVLDAVRSAGLPIRLS